MSCKMWRGILDVLIDGAWVVGGTPWVSPSIVTGLKCLVGDAFVGAPGLTWSRSLWVAALSGQSNGQMWINEIRQNENRLIAK